MKPKHCKVCKSEYTPKRMGQRVCGPGCALFLAKSERAKKERAQLLADRRKVREKLKTRSDWLKEAQTAVNKYVRLRDAHDGCISCDRPSNWGGQWHASHFRSVGAASAVRFNLWNIHKACSICNHHLSGNVAEYEPRLRLKVGDERVDWLRTQNHRVSYDIEYLKRLKSIFNRKAQRLVRRGLHANG